MAVIPVELAGRSLRGPGRRRPARRAPARWQALAQGSGADRHRRRRWRGYWREPVETALLADGRQPRWLVLEFGRQGEELAGSRAGDRLAARRRSRARRPCHCARRRCDRRPDRLCRSHPQARLRLYPVADDALAQVDSSVGGKTAINTGAGKNLIGVGVVLAGGSATAGVVAGLVLNARLLPFGFAVADVLGTRWRTRLLGAHLTDRRVGGLRAPRDDPAPPPGGVLDLRARALRRLEPRRRRRCGRRRGCPRHRRLRARRRLPRRAPGAGAAVATDRRTRLAALLGAALAVAATPFVCRPGCRCWSRSPVSSRLARRDEEPMPP